MSDSVRAHRLLPPRLLCPWDSPGKSGLPGPPPGILPDPGSEPTSLTSPALAGGFFTTWEILKDHRSTQRIASLTVTMQGWKKAIKIHTPRILEDTASYCFWNQPLTALATLAWSPVMVSGLLPLSELQEPFNLGDHEGCWEWQLREKQGSPTVQTSASTYSPFTVESKLSWRSSHYHRHSLSVAVRVKTQKKKLSCCFTGSHPVTKQ